MENPFDTLVETGTFGSCICADEDYCGEEDARCPLPATVVTVEGWIVCQRHAELIDTLARVISGS